MALNVQMICLQIAERLRDIATEQGRVPFKTGQLRKAHKVLPVGDHSAVVTVNLPYARAVHDGRPAIIIRPRNKRALAFKKPANWGGKSKNGMVFLRQAKQPARRARPWLVGSVPILLQQGFKFLDRTVHHEILAELGKHPAVTVLRVY